MTKQLNVYFHDTHIGELVQDNDGEMSFTYLDSWLKNKNAIALSCSLPLQANPFNRKSCRAFFSGILPEDSQRRLIAKNLGISANNDFSMLEQIGGECAGAITFIPQGKSLEVKQYSYHTLDAAQLAAMIRELPYRPLLAGDVGVRLSLAGVQDKMAVCLNEKSISIPLNGAPSTHILKPANPQFDDIIFIEAFCMNLAKQVGLPTAPVQIQRVEDIDFLLVERYDRHIQTTTPPHITRLHQEDFCQALGIVPEKKYQNEGGPSLIQCFQLLRDVTTIPVLEIEKLLDLIVFNILIGNCDAHGKNFSLLYHDSDHIALSPAYDLVSTQYYSTLSSRMAMKLGTEYDINKIRLPDFDKFAEAAKLTKPGVRNRIKHLSEITLTALGNMPTQRLCDEKLATLIRKRCEGLQKYIA